jgi:acyl-CoA synthetase (AMP-forming)/AMP-acid ligase II
VGRQEPVALLLDNSLDAVHAWSGLSLGGMVEVPVNTAYKGTFLRHVLHDSGVEVVVVEDRYVEGLVAVADDLPALRTVVVRGDPAAVDATFARPFAVVPLGELETAPPMAPVRMSPAELMAYMCTSGTTGLSKGVLIPHAQAYTYASREDQDRPRAGDRILVTLPIFHLAGQWFGVYQALIHQVRCVLEPGFSVSRFWDVVRHHGITVTVMLGAMAELLQQQPPRAGYHNLPDKTAETVVDGWVHTGDAFRADAEGRFSFSDRMKDALRRRGENVSSFEVERVINGHPTVFESAVVGVPSELGEDDIKAVVVARPGQDVDPGELTRFLIERLPYFMVPRYIELADELPRTPTHKVIEHTLREGGVGPGVWDREAAGIVVRRDR